VCPLGSLADRNRLGNHGLGTGVIPVSSSNPNGWLQHVSGFSTADNSQLTQPGSKAGEKTSKSSLGTYLLLIPTTPGGLVWERDGFIGTENTSTTDIPSQPWENIPKGHSQNQIIRISDHIKSLDNLSRINNNREQRQFAKWPSDTVDCISLEMYDYDYLSRLMINTMIVITSKSNFNLL